MSYYNFELSRSNAFFSAPIFCSILDMGLAHDATMLCSVPNRPVRTPGPWRPIVPSVPGGVGKYGGDGVRLV